MACGEGSGLGISFSMLLKDGSSIWHISACAINISPNSSEAQCKSQCGTGTISFRYFQVVVIFGGLGEFYNMEVNHSMMLQCWKHVALLV